MLSDRDLARLQLAAYEYDGKPFIWDWSEEIQCEDLVLGGIKCVGDDQVVIFPGTRTLAEWRKNFTAFPENTTHKALGEVHRGFFEGLEPFVAALVPQLKGGCIYVIGHSRGAAEAPLATALLRLAGVEITRLVMFAPPRAGEAPLAAYLSPVDKVLYRNVGVEGGHDYVTDVPFGIPEIAPYVHVGPLKDQVVKTILFDSWGPFKYHHMQLYAQALGA